MAYVGRWREAATKAESFKQPSAAYRDWGSSRNNPLDLGSEYKRLWKQGLFHPHCPTSVEGLTEDSALQSLEYTGWETRIHENHVGKLPPLTVKGDWLRGGAGPSRRSDRGASRGASRDVATEQAGGSGTRESSSSISAATTPFPETRKRFVDISRADEIIGIAKWPRMTQEHVARWLTRGSQELSGVVTELEKSALYYQSRKTSTDTSTNPALDPSVYRRIANYINQELAVTPPAQEARGNSGSDGARKDRTQAAEGDTAQCVDASTAKHGAAPSESQATRTPSSQRVRSSQRLQDRQEAAGSSRQPGARHTPEGSANASATGEAEARGDALGACGEGERIVAGEVGTTSAAAGIPTRQSSNEITDKQL